MGGMWGSAYSTVRLSRKSHGQPRVKQACGAHNLQIPIRKFLEVLQALGHMSCKFGPDRTVGLLTIAQSDSYLNPNPRVGISGVSGTPFYDPSNPTRSW
ncbi:unnamed protein product [Prunus armeniaca]